MKTVAGRWCGTIAVAGALLLAACAAPAPSPTSATSIPTLEPKPIPTPAADGFRVSEALAKRDAGELGSDKITLIGYWSMRQIPHSCAAPMETPGELEVYCGDGEFGITERYEAILEYAPGFRAFPAEGPALTPWIAEVLWPRLIVPQTADGFYPPVPIVVVGHFDDPRAADCRPRAQQLCRDRFVVDEIVDFDPLSVPPATPPPTPTPFPDPPPPALFGPKSCPGDTSYAFVGWTTTADLNIGFEREGHVFVMVTANVIPIGEWIDDPNGSGHRFRIWGQRVCMSEDLNIGEPFDAVSMEFASVNGTEFKEWDDGRREPVDAP
jgi:hypothetical protein